MTVVTEVRWRPSSDEAARHALLLTLFHPIEDASRPRSEGSARSTATSPRQEAKANGTLPQHH
jgi:hypothetical protein